MSKAILVGTLVLGLIGCTAGAAKDVASDSAKGVVSGDAPKEASLTSGTRVDATIQNPLSSRTNKAGERLTAIVTDDVKNAQGDLVIPSGAAVTLTIAQLDPGNDQIRPEGRLSLEVNSVTVRTAVYPVTATLEPVPHQLQGRGITKDEAARIGAGTAIGAVAGQVVGKNTKSTVIGGAIGAIAGTAVAVHYAYRDVIVSAGTPIVFTLGRSLTIAAK